MANMTVSNIASAAGAAFGGAVQRPIATPAAPTPVVVASEPRPAPAPAKTVEPQLEQVQQAIDRVKQSIKPALANSLEFQVDESTGKTVVRIMDMTTNTLVRQIPSEEMLIIAKALDDLQGRGGLVKGRA